MQSTQRIIGAMLTKQFTIPVVNKHQKQLILMWLSGLGLGTLLLISPWLGLAGAIGELFVILALSRPVYLCYVVILTTVLASGMIRGAIIPYLIPNEAVLVLVTALAFPAILTVSRRRQASSSGLIITGLVILSAGTSVFPLLIYLVRGVNLSVNEIFSLIAPLQYLLIYLIFRYLPRHEGEARAILRLMMVCAAVVGLVGLLQTMRVEFILNLLGTWYRSSHEEAALEAGRVSSLLGAWNSLGTFLMLNLLVLRAISIVKPALMSQKTLFLVMVFCTGCLIASGSYAGLIGLALGLLLFETFDSRGRMIIIILLISIVILAIPLRDNILIRFAFQFRYGGFIPQTLDYRFMVWEDVFWPIIQKTWLWGFRPDLPATLAWQSPESQYLGLLLRSGIFSLLAHISWVGVTLVWLYRNIHTSNDLCRSLSVSAFILFIVLSIMGLTNPVFTFSGVIEYLWILLGLI